MTAQKRPYRKTRRAALEQRTRLRITESAVTLHGTLGPARTSISAVAQHAGVRRSTVYRHFPDEQALFAACSAHWATANPLPDLSAWARIDDPARRLATALGELYRFYRRNEAMLANLLRDEDTVAVVKQLLGAFHAYVAAGADTLASGRGERGAAARRVRAALGHALAFQSWRSLAREQGLDDATAAELMCRLVAAAALSRRAARPSA